MFYCTTFHPLHLFEVIFFSQLDRQQFCVIIIWANYTTTSKSQFYWRFLQLVWEEKFWSDLECWTRNRKSKIKVKVIPIETKTTAATVCVSDTIWNRRYQRNVAALVLCVGSLDDRVGFQRLVRMLKDQIALLVQWKHLIHKFISIGIVFR